jgi:peptide/nickel transport system permease protein
LATQPATDTDFSLDAAAAVAEREGRERVAGMSPSQLAWRRLKRNYVAMASIVIFFIVVACCLAAPLYADHIAGRGPTATNPTGTIQVDGKRKFVVTPDGTPIGPGFRKQYLLGADPLGRDVMVRLLYGGRNSLFVGFMAVVITAVLSLALGLMAGYFRGWPDTVIRNLFDVLWSFPVLLFAIALGTALALGGLSIGPISIEGDSLWIPIIIIGVIYVPYLGRPVRGQVLSLREKEFVDAAVAQGMGPGRIMFSEILPNLSSTILVFSTLIIANNILLEAALSFLGAGIQPPEPSWGGLIADGVNQIYTSPHLSLVPGAAIVIAVLSLNVFGDGLRDALDPRAKVRLQH